MRREQKEKQALVRKIVRARPKSPSELCAGCVWRMAEKKPGQKGRMSKRAQPKIEITSRVAV